MAELGIGGVRQLAREVHVDVALVSRCMTAGVTAWQADRWATRLGVHPVLIWPEWLDVWAAGPDLPDAPYREHRNRETVKVDAAWLDTWRKMLQVDEWRVDLGVAQPSPSPFAPTAPQRDADLPRPPRLEGLGR